MRRMMLLGMSVSLLAIAGAALAYPTLLGPSGGLNLPTATIAEPGTVSVAADYYNNGFDGEFLEIEDQKIFRLLYGVSPNWEIGALYSMLDVNPNVPMIGDIDADTWSVNAKYYKPVIPGQSAWALGAVYLEPTDNNFNQDLTELYWVGSRIISPGSATNPQLKGSLGVNWIRIDSPIGEESGLRPYVVLDLIFPNKLNVIAEYQFKDDDLESDALSSIAARYPFTENLSGQIGFTNSLNGATGGDDHNIIAGLNYKFGGR